MFDSWWGVAFSKELLPATPCAGTLIRDLRVMACEEAPLISASLVYSGALLTNEVGEGISPSRVF